MTQRKTDKNTVSFNPKKQKEKYTPTDKLYNRPYPNPFTENWKDGYTAGYDEDTEALSAPHDMEWRDGYYTGQEQLELDRGEMDRNASSNS